MTIPATTRKAGPFTGNGSNTAFPFTFKVFTTTDVAVIKADVDGVESTLTLDSDYSVTLNSDQDATPGGTVTYPISGSPLPSTDKLSIKGDVDYQQGTDIPTGGDFNPVVLENALDSLSMQIQQVQEAVSRAAVVPITSAADAEALVADIALLASKIDNLDTIFAGMADITTVANDLNEPVSEIETVAGSIANVNVVGAAISNVNAVAGNATNINTVAGINTNVTTVAGIAANVTTVAGISANVTSVAGNATNINAVAANEVNIDAVAANETNIDAAVANATNINAVVANETNIDAVAGIAANVTTVAGIAANVTAVAGNATNINAVAANETNIDAVAGNATNINAVAADATDIGVVATNIAAVSTVATDIASVNSAAANMAAILDAPAQASAAAASAAAAAASLDNFDDRYLGSKASAPTLDNDGNALVAGALYFNNGTIVTDDKGMWIYDGGNWIKASSASQAILTTYKYVATAGQTVFTGADANSLVLTYTAGSIFPTLNGVKLDKTDYTATNGSTFTLAVAAVAGDELVIDSFATFNLANVYTKAEADVLLAGKLPTTAGAVGNTNLAANSVTLTKLAREGTAGQVLVSGGAGADPAYTTLTTTVPVDVQTFNSTGTWTKPTGGQTMARIQMWGGGGGGGNYSGAGGGGYNEIVAPLSDVNTQTATVAAGGAGSTTTGSAGGTSSFVIGGVTRYAYGGAGGASSSYGGRGGSGLATGLANQSGDPVITHEHWIGGRGAGAACTNIGNGSIFGGGGGAGQIGNTPFTSLYGGNGGAASTAGAQPGGGGGHRPGSGTGGAGGAGRIVVTCW